MNSDSPQVEAQVKPEKTDIAAPAPAQLPQVPVQKAKPSVVISIHGIRTTGKWQKELTEEMGQEFIHAPLDYGWFGLAQFLNPWTRDAQVKWFVDEYTRICDKHQVDRPSIVAHSLGTYLVAKAIERYELTFDRVIFSGSIVPCDFRWSNFRNQFGLVLNDYGRRDFWAWVARCVVRDSGPSGVRGFTDNANTAVIQREHPEFRHSDFHFRRNYQKVWIPFLRGDLPPDLNPSDRRGINWWFVVTMSAIAVVFFVVLYFGSTRLGLSIPAIRNWYYGPPVSKVSMAKFFDDRREALRAPGSPGIAEFRDLYESAPQPVVEWEGKVQETKRVQGILTIEIAPQLVESLNSDTTSHAGAENCARCTFNERFEKRAATIRKGQHVKLRGQIDGPVDRAIMLVDCELVD